MTDQPFDPNEPAEPTQAPAFDLTTPDQAPASPAPATEPVSTTPPAQKSEFEVAVQDQLDDENKTPDEEKSYKFKLDKGPDAHVFTSYEPLPGQMSLAMMSMGRGNSDINRATAILSLIMETLEESDQDYLANRMASRKNPIDMDALQRVGEWLMGQWFGRPTQPSSDSTSSPPSTGDPSQPTTDVPTFSA